MEFPIRFNTSNDNSYLLTEDKYFLPLHPLLDYILQQNKTMGENGYEIPERIIINEKVYSKGEIEYYYKKYLYLKNAGVFSSETVIKSSGRISVNGIRNELANLTQLVFEVTEECNLNCNYCTFGSFYEHDTVRERKYQSHEIAKKIIDYLVELWNSPLNKTINREIFISFYGGEPLLNMKLIEKIIDYIENFNLDNINFKYSMTTNAVLLNKYMDYLVEKNFSISISLDGDSYNHSFRVDHANNNSFPNVYKNIKLLQNWYPDFFRTNVLFMSVLHSRNSISGIFSFIEKEFGKVPTISEVSTLGIKTDKEEDFKQLYKNKIENFYQDENYEEFAKASDNKNPHINGLIEFINIYSGNMYKKYESLLASFKKISYVPTGTCMPFKKKMFITARGEILVCEKIGHQYVLGMVNEQTVDIDFDFIVQKYNNYYEKLQNQCDTCNRQLTCPVCIYTLTNLELNPKCNRHFGLKELSEYLSRQILFLENAPELYKTIMEEYIVTIY